MSKITKNVITTKTKYDNTASYQGDDTNAYVPLTDVLIAGEGVSVTTDEQGRVVVSASGGGGGGGLNKYTYAFNSSTFSFSRLSNIMNNAKGRISLQALDNYMSSGQGSLVDDGTTVQIVFIFDIIGEDIGRYILGFMDGDFMAKMLMWLETGNEISDVSSEINNMTITYFNDSEIIQ